MRHRPLPARWMLLFLALSIMAGVFITHGTLLGRDAGVALLTAMSACKLLEARSIRDGVVLVFLGYLLVMSNLLYNQDIPLVAYLVLVVTLIVVAQILIQPQHADLAGVAALRLAGKMVLVAFPIMLVLFVLFPRIPGPLWGLPKDAHQGRTGLSGEMEFGGISELIRSGRVALRVRFHGAIPPPAQRYWRGPVLWNFDGRRWMQRDEPLSAQPLAFTKHGAGLDYAVIMEPSYQRWLLALDLPATLPPQTRMASAFQIMRNQPVHEVYRYELRSYPHYQTGELDATERVLGLRLPPQGNPQARELVAGWRNTDAQPEALVKKALSFFREQSFYYTLNPPLLGTKNSIDDFLFKSRRGFCEHYAGSFVFMMRAADVPARVVTGYLGGEHNESGDYLIVRQSDAHAWAEVWLPERGWVRVDPTAAVAPNRVEQSLYAALPDAEELPFLARRGGEYLWMYQVALHWDTLNIRWNEWVLAYSPERQREFLSSLGFGALDWRGMTIMMVAGLSGLAGIFLLLRWRKQRNPHVVARAWQRFCARLAAQGVARYAYEGPLDFAQRAATQNPQAAPAIQEIGRMYAQLRYGRSSSVDEVRRFQRLVKRFRVGLKRK